MRQGWLVMMLPLFLAACGGSAWNIVPDATVLVDAPDHFIREASQTSQEATCFNPLLDPRDQTRLVLIRSMHGLGDYEAPVGRYGLAERQLIRVRCADGQLLGAVRR